MTVTAPQRLDVWPNGNPRPDQHAGVAAAHERLKDCEPDELSAEDLAGIGHERRSLLAVIRQNYTECQGGNSAEVRRCRCTGCVFWPFRMGRTPKAFVSDGKRAAGQRLALSRRPGPLRREDFPDDALPEG